MKIIEVPVSHSYQVKIGPGLMDTIGIETAKIAQEQVLVVTDDTVAPLYLARVCEALRTAGLRVSSVSVPSGEASKNLGNYAHLLKVLAEKRFTRSDAVLALGGGIVGDLSGFAAATYLRGIAFLQVPTTLLAMVDSSVGGKTAVDLPMGKNLAGAFHQPALVLCDPRALDTLPQDVFRDGCAEVIKTAVLFDRPLFEHLKQHGPDFDREAVIARCVQHKRDVVCRDEFDTGERQKLNLGHTIGHAIEKCSGYTISHGNAVAIGLACMVRAYCRDAAEILAVLQRFGLPTDTEYSAEALTAAALSDKKRAGGTITLVIPHTVGSCLLKALPVCELQAVIKAGL